MVNIHSYLGNYIFICKTHLGSYIIRGSTKGLRGLVTHYILLAHAKVRNLHMSIGIQENIIQLQIPIQYTLGM